MTEIQPIPGCWYRDEDDDLVVYLPRPGQVISWFYSAEDKSLMPFLGNPRLLVEVVHNPHGPETFRNHNFCPGCAEAMPDLPTDRPTTSEEVQF